MAKQTFANYIKGHTGEKNEQKPGPFITISRQFGCSGYELADILANRLNESAGEQQWKVYRKEILRKLANESGFPVESIEKARTEKSGFLYELLKNVRMNAAPDSFQIRSQIAVMVRRIAYEGFAIIVGQGGTAATADIENGLSVRVEAPLEWRLQRVCKRKDMDREQAYERMKEIERTRSYLRKTYAQSNPKEPAFNMTLDNSVFTAEQIAEQIITAMKGLSMLLS